jgi:kynurenine formamidase
VLVDLTVEVTELVRREALDIEKMASFGHLGTHFDVMNKEFPLSYTKREAVVFDASAIGDRDIGVGDIDISMIDTGMFVAFCTGFIEKVGYASKRYFLEHPQLSDELIDDLLAREISIIGIDFAGVRRGNEHTPKDQYCADRGVFIVENLCNLATVLNGREQRRFVANTYPIKFSGMTGLPCRVVGETPGMRRSEKKRPVPAGETDRRG